MGSGSRDQFVGRVVANVPLCREHYRLVLTVDGFPATEPGQFVQVACRDPDAADDEDAGAEREWSVGKAADQGASRELVRPRAFLRRPFSLAGRVDRPGGGGVELHLIQRVVGVGTEWLGGLREGDAVHLLGPLGNRFTLPPAGATALLVGGGVGIPPMLYLAEKLAGRPAVAFAGALTRDLLPLTISDDDGRAPGPDAVEPRHNVAEFARHGVGAVLATDDGSYGFRGFVTQALERYLDGTAIGPAGSGEGGEGRRGDPPTSSLPPVAPSPPVIYTCGPEPMMRRVADIAAARGLECQVAVERAMACGMGTCQSCCIRVRKPDPAAVPLPGRDWCWRLACTDGPVFRGAELLW
jgi:dihydroorotate dehydrogenase electron transfer subunit